MADYPPEKTVRAWRLAAIIGSMINGKMRFFARMEKGNYTERYQGYDGKRYHVNDTILLQDGPNRRYSLGVGYQLSHLQDATKKQSCHKDTFWGVAKIAKWSDRAR